MPTARHPMLASFGVYLFGLAAVEFLTGIGRLKPFSLFAIGGDNLYTLNYAKNYINGHGFLINPNLAFPGVQNNLYFPSFDFSQRLLLRIAALFSDSAAASYYFLYVVGIAAIYACCVAALRSLGVRQGFAILGAIIYTVSPYLTFRSFNHDFLALYYSAPLGASLALLIATLSSEDKLGDHISAGTIVSIAIIATSGLYYAFFSVLFVAFCAVASSMQSPISFRRLQIAALCSIIIFTLLIFSGFGIDSIKLFLDRATMVPRYASEQLRYGLTLAEATHVFAGIPFFERGYQEYRAASPHLTYASGLEEWPGAFLSTVILASPLILTVFGQQRRQDEKWFRLMFLAAACLVFGVFYSINGGLAYFFNFLVSPEIRATARIIPFLSFYALAIVLIAIDALWANGAYSRMAGVAACVLLIAAAAPSFGQLGAKVRLTMTSPPMIAELHSVEGVLNAKNANSLHAVLQLPHTYWPEAPSIRQLHSSSLLKYFVLDRSDSTTRWSHGSSVRQESFLIVKKLVDDHATSGLTNAARMLKFDGILVEKLAYDENELAVLIHNIEGEPSVCKLFDDSKRLLYSIQPGAC